MRKYRCKELAKKYKNKILISAFVGMSIIFIAVIVYKSRIYSEFAKSDSKYNSSIFDVLNKKADVKNELSEKELRKMIEEKSGASIIEESVDCLEYDKKDNGVKSSSYCDYDGDGIKEIFAVTEEAINDDSGGLSDYMIWHADCEGASIVSKFTEGYYSENAKIDGKIKLFNVHGKKHYLASNCMCTIEKGNIVYDSFSSNDNRNMLDGKFFYGGEIISINEKGDLCFIKENKTRKTDITDTILADREEIDDNLNDGHYERILLYKDGAYYETGCKKITYEQLCMFTNGKEVYQEIIDTLKKEEYLGDTDEEKKQKAELKNGDILYSSDGNIYMNFERVTTCKAKEGHDDEGKIVDIKYKYYYYASVERDGDKLINVNVPESKEQCLFDGNVGYFYEEFVDPRK